MDLTNWSKSKNMRINQIARKYHLDNKQILDYLESLGMEGKSHSSSLDEGTFELLLIHFGKMETPKPKIDDDKVKRFARVRRPKGWQPTTEEERLLAEKELMESISSSHPYEESHQAVQEPPKVETKAVEKTEEPVIKETRESIETSLITEAVKPVITEGIRPHVESRHSEPKAEPKAPAYHSQGSAPARQPSPDMGHHTPRPASHSYQQQQQQQHQPQRQQPQPQQQSQQQRQQPQPQQQSQQQRQQPQPQQRQQQQQQQPGGPGGDKNRDEQLRRDARNKKKKQVRFGQKKPKLKTVVLEPKLDKATGLEITIEASPLGLNRVDPVKVDMTKEEQAKHDQEEAIRREIQKLKLKQKRASEKVTPKDSPVQRRDSRRPHPVSKGKGKKAWKREKKERLEQQIAAEEQQIRRDSTVLKIHEATTVADIASGLGITPNALIAKLISMGVMASINQRLDKETVQIIADDFGYKVEEVDIFDNEVFTQVWEEDMDESRLVARPPVVTIMGHVDHGKTKLLDAVRSSDIVSGEAGGITQHIGAYYVSTPGGDIVFLDTPGHAAFTAMRARGAMVTDIVILVVAATDGVMPQTVEAIHHAKAAGVPIIVALNKIDMESANIDRTKQQLSDYGLLPEEWGGNTVMVKISAKQKIGIQELLEAILLQAELLELKADPGCRARGTILEGRLEQGRGPVCTVLLQQGLLQIGDPFVTGVYAGRVRAMANEHGEMITTAGPSMPVEILGNEAVPSAGDPFIVVKDDAQAKTISSRLQQIQREREIRRTRHITLDALHAQIMEGQIKELQIIVKGDVQGSVGALSESLLKIESEKVRINIIHNGVGAITESDVMLASASNALIIGFNVRPYPQVADLAKREHVDIRTYRIIYDAINDIRQAMTGMLEKTFVEKSVGTAEVREVFRLSKGISIAGLYVQQGQLVRNKPIRLLRDGVIVHEGKLSSLKRFKDDVKDVQAGFECGIGIENFNDIRNGDVVECYDVTEVAPTL